MDCVTGFVTVHHFLVDTCVWPVTTTCVLSLKPDMPDNRGGLTATRLYNAPMLLGLNNADQEGNRTHTYVILTSKSVPSPTICGSLRQVLKPLSVSPRVSDPGEEHSKH